MTAQYRVTISKGNERVDGPDGAAPRDPEVASGVAARFKYANLKVYLLAAIEGHGVDDRRAAVLRDDVEHLLHRDGV